MKSGGKTITTSNFIRFEKLKSIRCLLAQDSIANPDKKLRSAHYHVAWYLAELCRFPSSRLSGDVSETNKLVPILPRFNSLDKRNNFNRSKPRVAALPYAKK